MTTTSVSTNDAVALQAMMMARGGNSSGASLFDGFWSNYYYYLTNPSAMDTDLEYGFYGFLGTTTGLYNETGAGWATMGYWTSITGIPILSAESAIAGAGGGLWIANHPCLSRAIQAFVNGWIL